MMNILEAFANDNLHPNSRHLQRNSAYGRAMERLTAVQHTLLDRLDESQRALLEDFTDAQDDMIYLDRTDQFIYAYRLGVLMTMEVFRASDEIVTGGEE